MEGKMQGRGGEEEEGGEISERKGERGGEKQPPSLPPYGFRFNPKEQVVSGKGWGLRKVIWDAAGLPATPAWGSRHLGRGGVYVQLWAQ